MSIEIIIGNLRVISLYDDSDEWVLSQAMYCNKRRRKKFIHLVHKFRADMISVKMKTICVCDMTRIESNTLDNVLTIDITRDVKNQYQGRENSEFYFFSFFLFTLVLYKQYDKRFMCLTTLLIVFLAFLFARFVSLDNGISLSDVY